MRFEDLSNVRRAETHTLIRSGVSRRRFLAGAATGAAAATAGLFSTPFTRNRVASAAASPGIGLAVPIPYGLDFFGDGRLFHVEAPPFPGAGEDPATVYNLRGTSGIAFIDGLVDRTNRKTGVVETLPFTASDMRFMQGVFRGRDGHVRNGTFGFV